VEIGLLHLHRTLAYLVFLVALADMVLALTKARTDPRMATILRWSHSVGVIWAGRVTLVVGGALMVVSHLPLATWWIWVCLLLWGPVEAVAVRLVKPDVQAVLDGGTASGRLVGGTLVQLVCIVTIFGLMSVRP
jgi:hypothetical protein